MLPALSGRWEPTMALEEEWVASAFESPASENSYSLWFFEKPMFGVCWPPEPCSAVDITSLFCKRKLCELGLDRLRASAFGPLASRPLFHRALV